MKCERNEFLDIDEVFPGMSRIQQGIQLAFLLLKYERLIKEQLSKDGCYNTFCEKISYWKNEFLGGRIWSSSGEGEEATMELYSICCEFGVIQFLMDEVTRTRGGTGCGGGVRTRGTRGDLQMLRQHLEEVAKLFGKV